MIRVLIADDHPIVLEGLRQLFATAGRDLEVVGLCVSGSEALEKTRQLKPDIGLFDVRMPDLSGVAVLRAIRHENLATRVVLLTANINDDDLVEAMRLNVGGVVLKESAPRELLQCVRSVAAGQQWIDAAMTTRAFQRVMQRENATTPSHPLTPRELEIVAMVASGLRNRRIAETLKITEGTVKIHLHSVYQKLGIGGRVELVNYARDNGLV